MLPPVVAEVVSRYCVSKVAVYWVEADGAITVCEIAPLSDQRENVYCVPAAPGWGDVVAIVCVLPAVHVAVQDTVQGTPSMLSERPGGTVANVWVRPELATVHVPIHCHPVYTPALSSAYRYSFLVPENDG
jgi:hypothetical protein